NVSLEGRLLCRVQDVAGRIQKHHRAVTCQRIVVEERGILTRIHMKAMRSAEQPYGLKAGRDRLVTETGSLREDQQGKGVQSVGWIDGRRGRGWIACCHDEHRSERE